MNIRLVLVGALALAFLGGGLVQELQRNREMLTAQHAIVRQANGDACPALSLTNPAAFDTTVNELQVSDEARLQQIEGLYFLAKGEGQDAERVLAAAPHTTAVDSFWLGCAAYKNGDLKQAIEQWQRADAGEYFTRVAHTIHVTQGAGHALPNYQIAVQVAPNSSQAWLGLAQAELDLAFAGKFAWNEMLDSAQHALALAPENGQAHYLVGWGLRGTNTDLAGAERELRIAFQKTNGWIEEYSLASVLLDEGKADEATPLLEDAVKRQDSATVETLLVRAYLMQGRCDDAAQRERIAVKAYPQLHDELTRLCASSGCECG